jgi:hypothetical protein
LTHRAAGVRSFAACVLVMALIGAPPGFAAAPGDFDFSGYADESLWRSVYLGRFSQLTPTEFEAFQSPGKQEAIDGALKLAVFEWHRQWANRCAPNSKEPLTATSITREYANGLPPAELKFQIRTRYVERWRDTFNDLNRPRSVLTIFLPRAREIDPADLSRILRVAGCDSDMVKLFEENLHRAQARQPPLQQQSAWPLRAPRFHAGCAAVMSGINPRKSALSACACAYEILSKSLAERDLWNLEDDFSRGHFLLAGIANVGQDVPFGACLR